MKHDNPECIRLMYPVESANHPVGHDLDREKVAKKQYDEVQEWNRYIELKRAELRAVQKVVAQKRHALARTLCPFAVGDTLKWGGQTHTVDEVLGSLFRGQWQMVTHNEDGGRVHICSHEYMTFLSYHDMGKV